VPWVHIISDTRYQPLVMNNEVRTYGRDEAYCQPTALRSTSNISTKSEYDYDYYDMKRGRLYVCTYALHYIYVGCLYST
jgi:hypothetical protein